jgi:hypothetical protein
MHSKMQDPAAGPWELFVGTYYLLNRMADPVWRGSRPFVRWVAIGHVRKWLMANGL